MNKKSCDKCGKENNQDSKFCNGCGNKFANQHIESNLEINNNKESKTKSIFIILGIVISVLLLLGIVSIGLFIKVVGNGIDGIKDKIVTYEEKEENRKDTYDSITTELVEKNIIPNNWKYVESTYSWGMESVNLNDKYYFYIDIDKYDTYKKYWLEDVDKSLYYDDFNRNLWETGDYVFYAINVSDLSYKTDIDYGNIHLSANKTYYLVQFYTEAIYFKYICDYRDDGNYMIDSNFKYKEDSLSKEYIFHQENGKWEIEELIR